MFVELREERLGCGEPVGVFDQTGDLGPVHGADVEAVTESAAFAGVARDEESLGSAATSWLLTPGGALQVTATTPSP